MSPRCSPSSVLSVSLRYSNCMSLFPLDICTANFGRVTLAVCRVAMEPVEVRNALDGGKKKKKKKRVLLCRRSEELRTGSKHGETSPAYCWRLSLSLLPSSPAELMFFLVFFFFPPV